MQHENQVTDEQFFEQEVERGFTTHHWQALLDTQRFLADSLKIVGFNSVFEIGSGLGAFLIGAKAAGIDARGMDCNPIARDFAISKGVDQWRYIPGDVRTFTIDVFVDCILCVEVFEHCSDAELEPICRQLASHCRWFYFTSIPYQHESDKVWGHINLKSKEEWILFFKKHGLTFVRDEKTIVEWGLLFRGTL